ncbi:MAG: metal-dependent transcriptional regulator [Candidatus Omnitrophica bacterium]|nr:metal-dependent transcriptional regulator [Candidatus Omnitrophota bacterium]
MSQMTNDSTYWRAFDENKVSHSVAHYLMAIDHLRSELGYARVTDVAGLMNISRGAASLALSHLKEKGLVEEDPNRFLLLSEEGNSLARTIEHNFVLLTCFFENVLGMDPDIARADACKIEHLLSEESSKALIRFLRILLSKKDFIQELSQNIKNAGDVCEGDAPCPLCEPSGECLMPHTDALKSCPLQTRTD